MKYPRNNLAGEWQRYRRRHFYPRGEGSQFIELLSSDFEVTDVKPGSQVIAAM
jgi:hypothetical protein